MAFERVEGSLGLDRFDYHAAMISHKIVAMLRDSKSGKEPTVADFMPRWGEGSNGDDS